MFQKSIKNGFNDLYIHPNVISRRLKSNSYLRSISAISSINSSTPNLCNVNLTQIMAELLVASTSLKKSCNNLYLHCKVFQMNRKSNSYMTSISCHSPVNPSILIFPSINLTQTIKNLLVPWKVTQKLLQ